MEGYCMHPCEDDDCGGYCVGRECETCKYFMPYDVEEMIQESIERDKYKKHLKSLV